MQRHDRPSFGLIHKFLSILYQHVSIQNQLLLETLLRERVTGFARLGTLETRTRGVTNCPDPVAQELFVNLKLNNNKVNKSLYLKLTSLIKVIDSSLSHGPSRSFCSWFSIFVFFVSLDHTSFFSFQVYLGVPMNGR
jgi:hypothetical protein